MAKNQVSEDHTPKIKIIIAENQLLIQQLLVMNLQLISDFFILGTAKTGVELLDTLQDKKPDIILMDLTMPKINGFEATRIIDEKMPWIKVIGFSVHTYPIYIRELLRSGAKGFISKDSAFEELCQAIRQVFHGETYLCKTASDAVLNSYLHNGQNVTEIHSLTNGELRIIHYLADGLQTKEIAAKLFISEKTVERHKTNIFRKLKLRNTAQLIRVAVENGILLPNDYQKEMNPKAGNGYYT